jgi:hypothetical protein
MFVDRSTGKLVFFSGMFITADIAHHSILGMPALLCSVAQGPAASALLNEGKGLEVLHVNSTTKHEEGGLQKVGGGLAILIKECECNRAMSGIHGNVSLKPTGVRKKCEARA